MSGETREALSGWTVDTLHEHFRTQLVDMRSLLDERYGTQTKALDAAFSAAEKAVGTALLAAEKAVQKAEVAADKRFDSVNEFRQTLTDQTATFMTRQEVELRTGANVDKIDTLASRLDLLEGRSAGLNAGWLILGQFVSIIGALVAIVIVVGNK